jgi:DnaJ-domain-containing protein 1
MSTLDRERLARWLRGEGGSDALVRAVASWPWTAETWQGLGYDDRRMLVEGLLLLVCDPRADEAALDLVERVGGDVGFTSSELEGLVGEVLGITAARLRAHAVLGLPLHATPEDIKQTHRMVAKALHPDRLQGADEEARKAAEHLLGRINQARAALLSAREIVTSGPDDVRLEPVAASLPPEGPPARAADDLTLDEPQFDEASGDPSTDLDLSDLLEPG